MSHQEVVFNDFGRVRDIIIGPDGFLYVSLSLPGQRLSDTTAVFVVVKGMIPGRRRAYCGWSRASSSINSEEAGEEARRYASGEIRRLLTVSELHARLMAGMAVGGVARHPRRPRGPVGAVVAADVATPAGVLSRPSTRTRTAPSRATR